MWTDDSLDWERNGVSSIVSRVMAAARPGAVILFHDAGGERSQTVAALRIVLDRLRADGYTFGHPCGDVLGPSQRSVTIGQPPVSRRPGSGCSPRVTTP